MYIPTPPPSAEARELADLIERVMEAYRIDHPNMSPLEVRRAVKLAERSVGSPINNKVAGLALMFLILFLGGIGLYVRSVSGTGIDGDPNVPWVTVVVAIIAAVAAVFFTLRR